MALLFMAALTVVMLIGSAESAAFHNASMAVYLALVALIVSAGGAGASAENYVPFVPFGVPGIFAGASSVFFSFIGFDMVASMAEEAVSPARDLPIGAAARICTRWHVGATLNAATPLRLLKMSARAQACAQERSAVAYGIQPYRMCHLCLCTPYHSALVVFALLSKLWFCAQF
mmetsp:Transcript_2732/g.7389  ORF Transcript_2732/g.7389 Transcript_2732/m.7389 type:complete len:174 (-) Transcript_2732:582-1103(-)